jgi:putative oxidoreductase
VAPGKREVNSRASDRVVWALRLAMAVVFVYFGAVKVLPGNASWVQMFDAIGLGQWFRYLTSALEVGCGILLVVPRTAPVAAVLLAITMVGATMIRLLVLEHAVREVFTPVACLGALVIIGWHHRRPPTA